MEIHFEIENKCLLECRHCSSKASTNGPAMEYSVDDMVSFLKNIEGRKDVFLTGGEPLLYPEIDTVLAQLNSRIDNIVLGLFTTGIREVEKRTDAISESYAKQLAESGLKVCYLSVYSHRQEEHDWMTNQLGSFELTRLSVSNLRNAGIEVRFNSVVTARNEGEIPELIELAKKWDASEVRLLKLIRHGRAEGCWDDIGITEERYREIVRMIFERENPVRITASGAIDIVPCRLFYNTGICPAGQQLWYVTYQGDVYPCASVKNRQIYKIGDIKEWVGDTCVKFCERLHGQALCLNLSDATLHQSKKTKHLG